MGTTTRIDEKFSSILALEENVSDNSGGTKTIPHVTYNNELLDYDQDFKLVFVTQSKLSSDQSCSQPTILFALSSKALEKELLWIISYEVLPEESEIRQNAMSAQARLSTESKRLQNENCYSQRR